MLLAQACGSTQNKELAFTQPLPGRCRPMRYLETTGLRIAAGGTVAMQILIINHSEISELLSMDECIQLMTDAFKALSREEVVMPLRSVMWLPDKTGLLGMMPACVQNNGTMGLKVVSVFPGNRGTEYESHMGAVMLFETEHGRLLAVMDGSEITAIRTAAASGVATRLLAGKDAGDLAILGSGTQARMHLEAMLLVRPIRRVRVWSLPLEDAREFAELESDRHGIEVECMGTALEAVEGADIICTTTSAREPVLLSTMVSPGAHINAVGSCTPQAREVDTETVLRSRLFVDCRESTLQEAGDFLIPKNEGVIGEDHILGEIGEILLGRVKGRRSGDEITLFESLGLAVEDLVSARYVYDRAIEKKMGTFVDLGGGRLDPDRMG